MSMMRGRAMRTDLARCAALLSAASALLVGCPTTDDTGPIEPTYENVEKTIRQSCTFGSSCHGDIGAGKARMNFAAYSDVGLPVLDVLLRTSCEYSNLPRVTPGDPENSWLMIKLEGAHDARTGALSFTPEESWEPGIMRRPSGEYPASECPLVEHGEITFGTLMPQSTGAPTPLPRNQIDMFREWILRLPDRAVDAGPPARRDGGVAVDGGVTVDGGEPQASDAGADEPDAGQGPDAGQAAHDAGGPGSDAGAASDAGRDVDAWRGSDAGRDETVDDAGTVAARDAG